TGSVEGFEEYLFACASVGQDQVNKLLGSILFIRQLAARGIAGVEDQTDAQRRASFPLEMGDFLFHAIFKYLHLIRAEINNPLPTFARGSHGDVDEFDG